MSRITLKQLAIDFEKYADKQVNVSGWVRTIRDSKNFAFIELNDGTFFKSTQIIADSCLDNYKKCRISKCRRRYKRARNGCGYSGNETAL